MSSKSATGETGVSDGVATEIELGSVTDERTQRFDVERRLLCERIEELEWELVRERRRRDQVVDHYERLLEAERCEEEDGSGGWLRGLF